MSTVGAKKQISIDFTDVSGGVNSVEHPVRIGKTQVQPESIGFMLKKSGIQKYPGCVGLTAETTFTTYLKMLSVYKDLSGTERLLALSDGVLNDVDYSGSGIGSNTPLYSLTGTGEGWSCTSHGKQWVCNGAAVVKVETSGSAYRVGIAPPAGVTAAASAGAGLADGQYSIYATYGRRISTSDKLYSSGQYVGTVTLGSGNNRITISDFANSADGQVGQKVIWIKGVTAGETVHYFFYATNDNTTTTFVISSASAKNTSLIYEYDALDNGLPPAGSFIYAFSNRIWILKDNIIYYSDKAFTEYDLEIFRAANYIVTPFKCTGMFNVGTDLFVNTDSGILIIPNADPSAITYIIEPRWHFTHMRTVARWNNGVIGLTNDGLKIFSGGQFSNFDITYPIKDKVDKIYSSGVNFQPCGFVYRRGFRNEYHLLFQDQNIGAAANNVHAILNLDSMYFNSPEDYRFAWEYQPFSGNYAAVVENGNTLFIGQSSSTASKIYYESSSTDMSVDCYDREGTLLTSLTEFNALLRTRIELPNITGICWFKKIYALHQNVATFYIKITVADKYNKDSGWVEFMTSSPSGGETAIFDQSNFDESYYPIENAAVSKKKVKDGLKGRSCYIEVNQLANDPLFKLMDVAIIAELEVGNFL